MKNRALASSVMIAALALFAAAPSVAQYTDDTAPNPAHDRLEQPVPADDAKPTGKEWQFLVAPYFWMLSINGRVQIRNVSAPIDVGFNKLWDLLIKGDMLGGMGHVEAHRDRFTFFVDSLGGFINVTEHRQLRSRPLRIDASLHFAMVEWGPTFRLGEWTFDNMQGRSAWFEVLAGGRFWWFDQSLDLTGDRLDRSASATVSWVDPFVGARYSVPLPPEGLRVTFRGDIGGFGAGSNLTWNLVGSLDYALPWKLGASQPILGVGYRGLDFDFQSGSGDTKKKLNLLLQGPFIGVGFAF